MLIRLLGNFYQYYLMFWFDYSILSYLLFFRVWTNTLFVEMTSLTNIFPLSKWLMKSHHDFFEFVEFMYPKGRFHDDLSYLQEPDFEQRVFCLSLKEYYLILTWSIVVNLSHMFHHHHLGNIGGNFLQSTHLKEIPSYPAVACGKSSRPLDLRTALESLKDPTGPPAAFWQVLREVAFWWAKKRRSKGGEKYMGLLSRNYIHP